MNVDASDPSKYWPMYEAGNEFVRLVYLLLEGQELKVPVNHYCSYVVQIQNTDGIGFKTCMHPRFLTLDEAQEEAKKWSRRRKHKFRTVRFDILTTIIEPKKAKRKKEKQP